MLSEPEEKLKINKEKILRALISLGVMAVALLLIVIAVGSILPDFLDVLADGDKQEIQEYLRSFTGFWAYAVAFLLQFIQIITIFLPSVPIQIAVGILFGVWKGFLVCYAGYVAASALVFILSRTLGDKLDKIFPKRSAEIQKRSDDIQNNKKKKFVMDKNHPAFMVFLASILPILPNGFVPYIAAKTKMKFSSFVMAVGIGCVPTILTLCAVGNHITVGKWWAALLYTLPLIILVVVMFWQQKNIIKLYTRFIDKIKSRKQNRKQNSENPASGKAVDEKTADNRIETVNTENSTCRENEKKDPDEPENKAGGESSENTDGAADVEYSVEKKKKIS